MDRTEFPHLNDSQYESVRKMAGIFGTDALRSLAAATPAEQVERINAFDTYERGLIAHVQGLQATVAAPKPVQPKPLRLKVHPFEGKEGENLHFWVREVELAMDAALVSDERLRVAFALSNLSGRARVGRIRAKRRRLDASHHGPSCASSCGPRFFRRTTSTASVRASSPANKEGASCMSTSRRCECSLPLWWGTPCLNTSR